MGPEMCHPYLGTRKRGHFRQKMTISRGNTPRFGRSGSENRSKITIFGDFTTKNGKFTTFLDPPWCLAQAQRIARGRGVWGDLPTCVGRSPPSPSELFGPGPKTGPQKNGVSGPQNRGFWTTKQGFWTTKMARKHGFWTTKTGFLDHQNRVPGHQYRVPGHPNMAFSGFLDHQIWHFRVSGPPNGVLDHQYRVPGPPNRAFYHQKGVLHQIGHFTTKRVFFTTKWV